MSMMTDFKWQTFDDETPMPFGKHKDTLMRDVPANYLLWLADQPDFGEKNPNLLKYIEERRENLIAKKKEESKAYFAAKKAAEESKKGPVEQKTDVDERTKELASGKLNPFDDDIPF